MKLLPVLALVLALTGSSVLAQAPNPLTWSSGPDLVAPRAECVAILAPDNAVLLVGGVSPSGNKVVPALPDGAAGWTTSHDINNTRMAPGVVRYLTRGILVFGGKNRDEPTEEVLLYDYSLGDSQDAEKMLVGRHQFAFAADAAGRTYAVGGLGDDESGRVFSSVERYTPSSDSWTEIAAFPDARYGGVGVGHDSSHVYVFGGATSGGIQSDGYRYVIAADTWEAIAPMPVAVRNAAAVLSQNRIYVMGGVSDSGPVATVQVYDLSTSLWSIDEPLPAARFAHGAVLGAQGQLLIAGGYDALGNASDSVWQSQRLNAPETAPVFNTAPVTEGSLDRSYSYQAGSVGNPVPSYSLITAPAGMSIDAGNGLLSWQPVVGQVGVQPVTVRATNRVGFADQTFDITVLNDTIAPTAPTNVEVVVVTADSVDLSWSGATDENGIDHYGVYRKYRCGFRGVRRCYALVQGNILGDTTTVTGLPPLSSHSYVVRAFDADGNESPNSVAVSFTTLSPPVNLRHAGATMLPANFPLQLNFYASANPAATFTVVSGPLGLTMDADTGVVDWTPMPSDVGVHTLEVMAANSGGTTSLSVDITVNPDAPQLSVQVIPGAGGHRDALAGSPWSAKILDGSHTRSTYSIVSAPAGMTIDSVTGLLSWAPTPDDAGQTLVTVLAVNDASTAELSFEFYVHFTGPVSNISVSGLTDLEPTATWSPPVGTGADRTTGYTIVVRTRYRHGRSRRTHTVTYEAEAADPSIVLTGLRVGKTYNLSINAVDETDNRGLIQTNPVTFASVPALPNIRWSVKNANGSSSVIAGQEAVVQLTNGNTAFGTTTYSLINAPVGFVLDPVAGEGRWTPAAEDVGTVPITIRATNDIGPKDVSIGIHVHFSGPVRNAFASRTENSAAANWQSPADNVFPVVSYRVTMHWQWGSRRRSRDMTTTGTSLAFGLIPIGAVWHKGVKITPVDATGHYGVSTPLIPYNGALPVNLPYSDPVWIESVTTDSNKVPVVEVSGESGMTADLEVTEDFIDWILQETLTFEADEVIQCPDPDAQDTRRGAYRLIIH